MTNSQQSAFINDFHQLSCKRPFTIINSFNETKNNYGRPLTINGSTPSEISLITVVRVRAPVCVTMKTKCCTESNVRLKISSQQKRTAVQCKVTANFTTKKILIARCFAYTKIIISNHFAIKEEGIGTEKACVSVCLYVCSKQYLWQRKHI